MAKRSTSGNDRPLVGGVGKSPATDVLAERETMELQVREVPKYPAPAAGGIQQA